ncbi:MAG: non-ribosomal peptide synthetase [Cyanobacteria bacterium P01_C01_bin.118]
MTIVSSIPQIIHHWSQETPDAYAIEQAVQPDRPGLTYRQLLDCSRQLVTQLNNIGVNRQDRVALVLPNGPEMAVATLSIAAGATCVLLNPDYPEQVYEDYLSDLKIKALIVQTGSAKAAKIAALAGGIPVLELMPKLDGAAGVFQLKGAGTPKLAYPLWAEPEDAAIILPTSGIMSHPKMVCLTHQNLCNSAQNIANTLALTVDDGCLNVMPFFHIHGLVGCLLSSLVAGGKVVCAPEFRAEEFLSWLQAGQPTWYSAIPTIHQAVLSQVQQFGIPDHCLRLIRSSSSAMSSRIMVELETTFNVPVIESYGMTEATHQITSNPLPPALRKPCSVGLPGQTEVAIAATDKDDLLPQGESGEVVIRGHAVTQAYVAEENEAAWFDGWLRTGDQGYLDKDGYLFLQGRVTDMVGRGGEKISPLEVDDVLMALPDVHRAVAFAFPHPTLGEELGAAVVLKPGAKTTPEQLRDYLFSCVAAVKVPGKIIVVDALPENLVGQLQRRQLATQLAHQLTMDFIAPQNDVEQSITDVMQEILQCDRISVTDNFFILGGDSLKATQVTLRLSAQFKVNLPNNSLFRHPTVAKLATEITHLTSEGDGLVQGILAQLKGLPPEEIERLLATG